MSSGTVLHVNEVGLLAAIEEGRDGQLRGRPFVVANPGAARAFVIDLSSAAHREGIRRGMVLSQARCLVPGLEVRPPRAELAREADERLWRIGLEFTPLVERSGSGHLFIDLAGTTRLHGVPQDAAQKLRERIAGATGLRPAMALASGKTVAKVATRVFRPSGFVALGTGEESGLIRRQPVGLLPGVGPVLLRRFTLLGIADIGDLADLAAGEALAIGPRGPELVARARGADDSPVNPEPPECRSLRGEFFFEPDTADPELLALRMGALVAELGFALRHQGFGARSVSVSVSYTDEGAEQCRCRSIRLLTRDDEILALARTALKRARSRRVRVRRIGLVIAEMGPAGPELDLFEPREDRAWRLQTALDRVREKHGPGALSSCAFMGLGATAAAAV